MFRLSQFMREVVAPTPMRPARPRGPVVIWNLIRRCNLNCKHCYSLSADSDFPGELSTDEVYRVMDDLRAFGVPVLILSGGEPLLRPDILTVSAHAKALGFYVGLSTNGALIDARLADRIAAVGYDYVGISLDGIGEVHDRFRRVEGAYEASLAGIRHCRARGVKVGVRFTMTEHNHESLPALLDLVDAEGVDKFYLSHLVYAGRGDRNRGDDAFHRTTRAAMDLLFERAHGYARRGDEKEIVTGNNDTDAVYFLFWVRRRFPECEARSAPGSPNGAATPRASTSPTSTTWARSTPTPFGGTTVSATSAPALSPRSGTMSPTPSWPGSSAARARSAGAAAAAATSTSAAATPGCGP